MTAALIVSVHAPLLWLAATLQSEWQAVTRGTRWRVVLRRLLLALVRNPIIVAIVGGSLWRMAGPPMPAAASQLLGMLGDAAIPTALFSLGLTLRSYGIRGNLLPAVVLSGLKLALLPMLVFALGAGAVGVDPGVLAVAVLVAASPTGVNAYIFAQRNGHAVGVVSTTIVLGTLFSMLTLPLVLSLVIGLGQP
jgi:predicted permease